MINLLLIFIPGFLTFYRHGDNLIKNIPPIIFIEIVPYAVLCMIVGESLFLSLASFLVLSIFYEIGYAYNDSISTNKELETATLRKTLASKYIFLFITVRTIYSGLFLYYIFVSNAKNFENFVIILLITTAVFSIHNIISNYYKVCTFTVLNILKIYFRILFITVNPNFFILAIFPHITIKLLHYLKTKKYINISEEAYKKLINPIYVGWIFFYIYISFNLFLFSLPFYFNHVKRYIFNFLKNK